MNVRLALLFYFHSSDNMTTDTLAYPNETHLDYPSTPIQFRTFPDPKISGGSRFRFLTTSCILPNFPWTPAGGRTIKGFDYMADYLFADASISHPIWPLSSLLGAPSAVAVNSTDHADSNLEGMGLAANMSFSTPPTEFLMFLGDFIYADVPFYFGNTKEAYRRLYRRVYNSPSFRKVYEKLRE